MQSVRGTLQDAQNTNRKVLDPTLDNLVRWAKSPGGYDLAGVDAAAGRKATDQRNAHKVSVQAEKNKETTDNQRILGIFAAWS